MPDEHPTPREPGEPPRTETGSDVTRTAGEASASVPRVDERIGSYRLLRKIGEGGMGAVYEALQEEPIRRRVALKLIKAGMDSERVIARFELERQTLAMLNHPSIAKVLDAGATASGRPFFVMEYVEGRTLNRYADAQRLDIDERLRLFIRICEAVQHAHQKGVIHRDLKSSNVLVEAVDGRPIPKIIDFGIARAVEHDDAEEGLTRLGDFVGTPAYMSPEQAAARADVDTRTDVYSLGVMLYELLAGSLPLDPTKLRERGIEAILRAVREDSPELPSRRLTTVGSGQKAIADSRHTDPGALRRELRGDLDWIVMRAMEKERDRRYPSASELAADIGRHLRHEPVAAGPPSMGYRARKFVRRHRLGVTAASLVAVSIVAGIVATTTAMVRALRAEREARVEAQTARRVSDFLEEIFDLADPGEARGNTVTAREILDRGVDRIYEQLDDEPETRARLLATMGRVYRNLSLYDRAKPLLEEAVATRESLPGSASVDTARVLNTLAGLLQKTGSLDEGLHAAQRARDLCERAGPEGREELGRAWTNIAAIHLTARRIEDARDALAQSVAVKEAVFGPDHPEVAMNLINLGVLEKRLGRLDESLGHLRQALEINLAVLGEFHPHTAATLNNLANTHKRMDELPEARAALERALAIHRKLYDGDHADLASTLNALGEVCLQSEDLDCAITRCSEALEMRTRILGPDHRNTRKSVRTLVDAYTAAGRSAEAEALVERYGPSS